MRFKSIGKVMFGLILGLSLSIIWKNCNEKKSELDFTQVYQIEIKNEVLIGFVKDYVQEMKELNNSNNWIVTLTANKINLGFHYQLNFANHALYAGLGNSTVEGRKEEDLNPPFLYTTIDEVIVIIYSGIEKLGMAKERHDETIFLVKDFIQDSYLKKIPNTEDEFEIINMPPTNHYPYWVITECGNDYQLFEYDFYGEENNETELLNLDKFCNW